ncbi:hypothetical protein [Streptomyces sp. V2I9]|uniref:hypothetical protein n=1 Tax=Streptomyces sp. V2I9 TaxID=3042304 RepID=UPI003594265F
MPWATVSSMMFSWRFGRRRGRGIRTAHSSAKTGLRRGERALPHRQVRAGPPG